MASAPLDPALVEFAETLDLSQVPNKFRCTACKNFLINAYKFGCCDEKFCENCYDTSVGKTCPQCSMKLNSDICEPAASTRKSIKAWLKTEKEKARVDQAKSAVSRSPPAAEDPTATPAVNGDSQVPDQATIEPSLPQPSDAEFAASADEPVATIENVDDGGEPHSDPTDAGDDDIEIQVEPSQEEQEWMDQQRREAQDQEEQFNPQSQQQQQDAETPTAPREATDKDKQSNNLDVANNMNFNNMNMDMMQQMQQMMANGMNPMAMMGMPMGMNPMAMFGGMNGINGMNMGMNFNPNQMSQMFGFQNNNMWQNSNSNAFSNGMGGDFQYGSNFNQQPNYPNGEFQGYHGRGYGRGRGRARGGYGRGRGNFRQFQDYQPNFQNAHEQQQYEIQNMQNQMNGPRGRHQQREHIDAAKQEEEPLDLNEFAPGGQDEVQDALGDDYHAKKEETIVDEPMPTTKVETEPIKAELQEAQAEVVDEAADLVQPEKAQDLTPVQSPAPISELRVEPEKKPIAEAYEEDLNAAMPPPSAPSGPSGKYGDRDFGFRGRGHGRFAPRSRGSIHLPNGHPPSPVRSTSSQSMSRPDSSGAGVVGAPTGPRAMREPREPPSKPAPREPAQRPVSNGGGLSILGRASRESAKPAERTRSPTPNDHDDRRDDENEKSSRRQSRREEESRYDAEREDHDRDRRRRKSKREDYDDSEVQDDDHAYSRSNSQDRKSSHKSRRERDKLSNSSKHQSSSRRHREEQADDDYDMDDYGEPIRETDSKSRHRSSKHRDRDEKDRHRDRERDRDKDRKRSRHDRDHDDEDTYAEERKHSKRRREHRDTTEPNGRSSHRSSEVPTPTSAATPTDPYAAEREARTRERQLKEQQRRDKAATSKSTNTAGRRVSYKYEDEAERGMLESERAVSAARWR